MKSRPKGRDKQLTLYQYQILYVKADIIGVLLNPRRLGHGPNLLTKDVMRTLKCALSDRKARNKPSPWHFKIYRIYF